MEQGLTPDRVPDEWFELYVMGRLPEQQTALLEERLLVDEECRRKLDETETYITAMRGALRSARRQPVRAPNRWFAWLTRPLPMATGGAFAVGAMLVVASLVYRAGGAPGPVTQTVTLDADRGLSVNAAAHPGHLQLRLDLRGIPERLGHTVQVVTEVGREVWSAPLTTTGDFVTVDVPRKLGPGDYLVRINSGAEPLREFRLAVQ
jgi:hypothetical protein